MKNLIKILCYLVLPFFYMAHSNSVFALEVDEKLTLRVLKVSDTKKTILINRGTEDGLVVGDHAKFFLTSGVVARGVVVKSSPSRSIWSIYRLIDENKISNDVVMNLKISTPVKVTEDESKVVYENPKPIGSNISSTEIPLAPGANDLQDLSHEEQKDLNKLEAIPSERPIQERPWEIFGLGHFDTLTSEITGQTATTTNANLNSSGENKSWGLLMGVERYAMTRNIWYSNFSLAPFIHYSQNTVSSLSGQSINHTLWEGGLGLNYHFRSYPDELKKIIIYGSVVLGAGKITENSSLVSSTVAGAATLESSYEGADRFVSLGVGTKYYFTNYLGGRILADYYRRYESYSADDAGNAYERTTSGFRINLGLAYRF